MNNLHVLFKNQDRESIEKWVKSQVQHCYLGKHRALARVLGKYLMYVDTRDLSLTPHLLMNGYWEMWVTQAIASFVKPGMRCLDIGANCGYYTVLLSDLVGAAGEVRAFEPQRELCDLIGASLTVNGFNRTSTYPLAVGAERDDLPLMSHHATEGILMGSASLKSQPGLTTMSQVAHVVTIDSLEDGKGFDFVKIDVQGFELEVLRGMKKTIEISPKIDIAMEFTPAEHDKPLDALLEIQGMGLTLRTIGTDGLVRPVTLADAARPDTGDHRMLWLSKATK